MTEVSASNFALLIAYVVPGFTALWGVGVFSDTLRTSALGAGLLTAPN